MRKFVSRSGAVGMAAILATCLAACDKQSHDDGPQYAKVTNVKPVTESVTTPHQVCRDVVVNQPVHNGDPHNIAGTAIGAVAGGAVGHLVGGGSGRKIATAAGAIGGGYAGNRLEQSRHDGATEQRTVQRCTTEQKSSSKVVGYDVTYSYKGTTKTTRMDHKPGDQVQVAEGVDVVQ